MGNCFDLGHDAGLAAAGDGHYLVASVSGFRIFGRPVVGDGVAVLIGEGAVEAGAESEAGEQSAETRDDENDSLRDAGAEGVLQVAVLDPAEKVLLGRDTDAAAHNEPERRQHHPVAPWMQGADEGPREARDDECNDTTEQDGGVEEKY